MPPYARKISYEVSSEKIFFGAALSLFLFVGAPASTQGALASPPEVTENVMIERGAAEVGPRTVVAEGTTTSGESDASQRHDESNNTPISVRVRYVAGTAFLARTCVYRFSTHSAQCGGVYGVGYDATWKNLRPGDRVCVGILAAGPYMFLIKEGVNTDQTLSMWGSIQSPQWSISSGLREGAYTCDNPDDSN